MLGNVAMSFVKCVPRKVWLKFTLPNKFKLFSSSGGIRLAVFVVVMAAAAVLAVRSFVALQ